MGHVFNRPRVQRTTYSVGHVFSGSRVQWVTCSAGNVFIWSRIQRANTVELIFPSTTDRDFVYLSGVYYSEFSHVSYTYIIYIFIYDWFHTYIDDWFHKVSRLFGKHLGTLTWKKEIKTDTLSMIS